MSAQEREEILDWGDPTAQEDFPSFSPSPDFLLGTSSVGPPMSPSLLYQPRNFHSSFDYHSPNPTSQSPSPSRTLLSPPRDFFSGTNSVCAPMSPSLLNQPLNFHFSLDDPSPNPTSPFGTFWLSHSSETKAPVFSNANEAYGLLRRILNGPIQFRCESCKSLIPKVLRGIEGVCAVSSDSKLSNVTVTGRVDVEALINKLRRSGKHAELWSEKYDGTEKISYKAQNNEREKAVLSITEISITLEEDLQQHFFKKREEAAKSLRAVSVSTVKRICIQRWPPSNKKNKGLNTFFNGPEGAFNKNCLTTSPNLGAVFQPIKENQSAACFVDALAPMQLETPIKQIPESSLPYSNALTKQFASSTSVVQTSPPETGVHSTGIDSQLDKGTQKLLKFDRQDEIWPEKSDRTNKIYKAKNNEREEQAILIPLKDLQQHFGKKREEAAKCLRVSVSKLKRASRQHGIKPWPYKKNKGLNTDGTEGAFNQIQPMQFETPWEQLLDLSGIELPCTVVQTSPPETTPWEQLLDLSGIELPCTVVQTSPPETTMEDVRSIMTVKATYENYIIKFNLSSAAKKEDLEKEVAKRVNLKVGSFTVKYMDKERDWVLIGCDEDLQYCMLKSLDPLIIKMLVE